MYIYARVLKMHVMVYYMSIGENIKKLRKSMGLTQVQLADSLGTTQKVITDYETGRSKPPRKRLPHIARFFNISVDELIGDDDLPEPTNGKATVHHGNSRSAHVLKLFDRLGEEEQRVILKQIKALAEG
ncbi:MAG: helix-turn-helix domain-containing protein [Chitinivibrionales bacterium]|nr:helix-turn-helix domain-containing protein [Chitinivibrionales bacterium]